MYHNILFSNIVQNHSNNKVLYWPRNKAHRLMRWKRRHKTHTMNFQLSEFRQTCQKRHTEKVLASFTNTSRETVYPRQKIKS